MDLQSFVDRINSMTCAISVERKKDGGHGVIRIVTGNKAYIDSIEDPNHMSSSEMLNNKFIPNCEYTRYIPQDNNFEEICCTAALEGHPVHTYIHPERYSFWINVFVMPITSDDPNIGYCTYTQELTADPDAELMTNVSADVSSKVLKTCIKLRNPGAIHDNFNAVIEDIREICDSDHCCILITDKENQKCTVFGESIKAGSGTLPMDNFLDEKFYSITEQWPDAIAGSTCFIAKEESELEVLRKRAPLWYDSLKDAGVSSIVLFPLIYNEETMGYLWALNFDVNNTIKIKETLEISAFFLAAEISNYQLVDKLKVMSSVDLLTGVKNRNAMNTRVDCIVNGENRHRPVGIIFTDINGLKYTNDHEGHNAGDTLIRNAAEVLRMECGDMEIYRAGGDEFMIIVSDLDEEGFNNMVEALRKHSDNSDGVSFAVGGCYSPNKLDIRHAMHVADEQMYLDKERYYQKYPDHRRK